MLASEITDYKWCDIEKYWHLEMLNLHLWIIKIFLKNKTCLVIYFKVISASGFNTQLQLAARKVLWKENVASPDSAQ